MPRGSTPLRELAHAIEGDLTLPNLVTTRDEMVYLRVLRDRVRMIREAVWKITRDREFPGRG